MPDSTIQPIQRAIDGTREPLISLDKRVLHLEAYVHNPERTSVDDIDKRVQHLEQYVDTLKHAAKTKTSDLGRLNARSVTIMNRLTLLGADVNDLRGDLQEIHQALAEAHL